MQHTGDTVNSDQHLISLCPTERKSILSFEWYRRWRAAAITLLVLLVVVLGWVAVLQNRQLLGLITPGTSAYRVWQIGEPVGSVAFDPTGDLLAVGLAGGEIQLRRKSDGTVMNTLEGHKSRVSVLIFSPDG